VHRTAAPVSTNEINADVRHTLAPYEMLLILQWLQQKRSCWQAEVQNQVQAQVEFCA